MDKAAKILSVTTVEGSKLLSKAGEEADNLLASKNLFLPDRLKDLASCVHLRQVRDDGRTWPSLQRRRDHSPRA